MAQPVYLYDRASGKCLKTFPNINEASEFSGVDVVHLRPRAKTSPDKRVGFLACSFIAPENIDRTAVFARAARLYLVECATGPLAGERVLFDGPDDIAAYFGWNEKTIASRLWRKNILPGGSNWCCVDRSAACLAKYPRWDTRNGAWDLECDLSKLIPKVNCHGMSTYRRKVYLYDRASGRRLKIFSNVVEAAKVSGDPAHILRGRMCNDFSKRRGFLACTWKMRKDMDKQTYTAGSALYLLHHRDGKRRLLFKKSADVLAWFDEECSMTISKVVLDREFCGGFRVERVFAPDSSLADVPRWEPDRGYWTLDECLTALNDPEKEER